MVRLAFLRENSGSSFHSSQCSQFADEETEGLSRAITFLRSSGWTVYNPGLGLGSLSPHPATTLKAVTALPKYFTNAAEALQDESAQTSSAALRTGALEGMHLPELQLSPLVKGGINAKPKELPCKSSVIVYTASAC